MVSDRCVMLATFEWQVGECLTSYDMTTVYLPIIKTILRLRIKTKAPTKKKHEEDVEEEDEAEEDDDEKDEAAVATKTEEDKKKKKAVLKKNFSASAFFGGEGGAVFNDRNRRMVKKITIKSGMTVKSIQIIYEADLSMKHGGNGGREHSLELGKDDYVNTVIVRHANMIQCLTFITNTGNKLEAGKSRLLSRPQTLRNYRPCWGVSRCHCFPLGTLTTSRRLVSDETI